MCDVTPNLNILTNTFFNDQDYMGQDSINAGIYFPGGKFHLIDFIVAKFERF